MAANITARGIVWTTTAGNKTVTFTPAVGDLIVLVAANSGRTTAQPPTLTDNNSSGTYTQIGTPRTKATSADSMWFFARNALVASAVSTIVTMTQASDSGGGMAVFTISGMTNVGAAARRQDGGQSNIASGTPAITLASAFDANNVGIGAVFTGTNGSANASPPGGFWSEQYDQGYATPASGIEVIFTVFPGETATTITWGGAAASAFCSMLVEFAAPAADLGFPYVGGGYYT